jgi:hypothetical protein
VELLEISGPSKAWARLGLHFKNMGQGGADGRQLKNAKIKIDVRAPASFLFGKPKPGRPKSRGTSGSIHDPIAMRFVQSVGKLRTTANKSEGLCCACPGR